MTSRIAGWRGAGKIKTPQWKLDARRIKTSQANSGRRVHGGKGMQRPAVSLATITFGEERK